MFLGKKQYTKLFFKILLLTVYCCFFSVQFFLRYAIAHSQQSLDYEKQLVVKTATPVIAFKSNDKTGKPLVYLNKRFQPQEPIILPSWNFEFKTFNTAVERKCFRNEHYIYTSHINISCLRGPPSHWS